MAIQLPNPGLGDGQTGDNEFVMWTKVKDNFSNTTHAANRLVGAANGQVPLSENVREAHLNNPNGARNFVDLKYVGETLSPDNFLPGKLYYKDLHSTDIEGYPKSADVGDTAFVFETMVVSNVTTQTAYGYKSNEIIRRTKPFSKPWTSWAKFWTTANATKDGNGFLKAASPVVDLYDDHIDLNGDAKEQGIEFVKNGKGDYTLKTKTGLRSDNTWQIEIPQDNNKNPLFAVDIDAQDDGTVNIKCYKRIFSMETFLFGPDFNEPMDIAEGRFISVRLNDNPEPEQLDEPIE